MPIRINLLAEAQAQERLRRRDPVKRVIFAGICAVLALLAYSSKLQLQVMLRKGEVSRIEGQLSARTNEFRQVMDNQAKLADVTHKLDSLHQLASTRLLYGTLLNAMQQTVVDDVQLLRMRVEQSYFLNEAVKAKTNSDNRVTAGRPASATERIVLTLEARDSGVNAGDQVNKFKKAIGDCSYFEAALGKTNEVRLASLSPPGPGPGGRTAVQFTVECRFPEKTR